MSADRKPVDYSKSVIYKFYDSNNPDIFYLGSTAGYERVKRTMRNHFNSYLKDKNNRNVPMIHNKFFEYVENNGGYDMFKLDEVLKLECEHKGELNNILWGLVDILDAPLNYKEKYNKKLFDKFNIDLDDIIDNIISPKEIIKNKQRVGIVYILKCKDGENKDIYVGSTFDLTKRKYHHKNDCNNEKSPYHNYKVYQFIRENGGWNNFIIDVLEQVYVENKDQLLFKEREIQEKLNSKLNVNKAIRISLDEYCEHENKRSRCKLCLINNNGGGNGLCLHMNRNGECTECQKLGIPQVKFCQKHSTEEKVIRKDRCELCEKETGKRPKGKCEHNTRRENCKECYKNGTGGSSICPDHGSQKQLCKRCWDDGKFPSGLCREHGERKTRCKDCNENNNKCPHGKAEKGINCKECMGANICPHKNNKYRCKLCNDK